MKLKDAFGRAVEALQAVEKLEVRVESETAEDEVTNGAMRWTEV